MVPLSPSAFGLGIVQGGVISQADVRVQGLPEPLTEEGLLPCGRCFREQEGAVQLFPVEWCRLHSHRWGYGLAREWANPLQGTGLLEEAADVIRQLRVMVHQGRERGKGEAW